MKMRSIRGYLLVSLILALTFGSLLVATFTYFHAAEEIDELYDKSMEDTVNGLRHQIEALGFNMKAVSGEHGYVMQSNLKEEENFLIQIWNKNETPIYSTHKDIPFPRKKPRGMHVEIFEGEEWRVYSVNESGYMIQVAQPQKSRNAFIREMTLNLLYPMLGQIPIIGMLIWIAVGFSLLPLSDISRAIQGRSANSLEPLATEHVPHEMQSMVAELNALLLRLQSAMQAQKRFTADAAHELRTPLTALKLQAEVLHVVSNQNERAQALGKLQQGIDRAIHVVQQLLTLARLEPESVDQRFMGKVDLSYIAHGVIEYFAELAYQKQIDLGMSRTEPAVINGDAGALRIMIENVIDNALRYTPEGGKIDVSTYTADGRAVIEISDNGIGIAAEERERIFERFYRVIGTDTQGTGLGLAIVKHISQRHAGSITIMGGIDGKGTAFILSFPALNV